MDVEKLEFYTVQPATSPKSPSVKLLISPETLQIYLKISLATRAIKASCPNTR
jgi:hypothetical protein